MDIYDCKLLFLVGAPRSGTKLLRSMLNGIDAIHILENETDLYPFLLKFFAKDRFNDDWFERLYSEISETKFFVRRRMAGAPIDKVRWRQCIAEKGAASVFKALLEASVPQGVNYIWLGDKSPLHLQCTDRLLQDFPNSRVIHIVRDGRDVSLSSFEAWGKSPVRSIHKWSRDTLLAHNGGRNWPDRYKLIKYESLLEAPKEVLKELCFFLGVEYVESALQFSEAPENLGRAIGRRTVVRSEQRDLTKIPFKTLKKMESISLPAARAFGYERTTDASKSIKLSNVELLWYLLSDLVAMTRFYVNELGLIAGIRYVMARKNLL